MYSMQEAIEIFQDLLEVSTLHLWKAPLDNKLSTYHVGLLLSICKGGSGNLC